MAGKFSVNTACIAIVQIQLPRDDDDRIAPAGRPRPVPAPLDRVQPRRIGREMRHRAVRALSCRTSRRYFFRKLSQSASQQAVPAKTCASPVQPSRSSRCGQSVGISMKFDRCDQIVFRTSRLTDGSPQVNPPA